VFIDRAEHHRLMRCAARSPVNRATCIVGGILLFAMASFCPAAVYNVRDYGAVGNGKVNDAAAIREALDTACKAGGGTVYLPGPAQYLIRVGGPGKSDLLTKVGTNTWAVLWIQSDNISIRCDNGATIYVVAAEVPQGTEASGSCIRLFYFGPERNDKRNYVISFRLEGGRYLMSLAPGVLLTESGYNRWAIRGGAVYDSIWHDAVFVGFPQGGLNEGLKRLDGMQVENTLFDRCHFLDWGGALHDNLFYVQGETTFRDCHFETSRKHHSHAVYTGGDRPGLRLSGCTFRGIHGSRGYPLHLYGEAGGPIEDIAVQESTFENCRPLLIGYASKEVQDVRLNGLRFDTGGGIRAERVQSLQISDCRHGDIQLVECTDVAITNCNDIAIEVSGQKACQNIRISNCSLPRKLHGGGSHLHLGSVDGCVVSGNTFDTTNTNSWATLLQSKGLECRDVVLQGNTFSRMSGGPSLVFVPADSSPRNIMLANNIFRVSTGGTIFEALAGVNVSIRGNQFDCLECPSTLTSIAIQAETGPWWIESNIEASGATGGAWQFKAPGVSLINNNVQHGIRGIVDRNEGNRIAADEREGTSVRDGD
jgi:hypothetical protein